MKCQLELQPFRDEGAHLLHARAIDAKIAVAGAGGGAEVDGLGVIVEQKFDIVYEAKQQAGGFVVEIGLVFLDKLHTGQGADDFLQRLFCLSPRFAIGDGGDRMALVLGLS